MLTCCCLLNTIIVIIITEFWDYFVVVAMLYTSIGIGLGIGIARGQYYWVLDIGCLSWYHSNPKLNQTILITCIGTAFFFEKLNQFKSIH